MPEESVHQDGKDVRDPKHFITGKTSRYNALNQLFFRGLVPGSVQHISITLKCCPIAGSKYNKPGDDIEIRAEVVFIFRNEFVRRNFNFLLCF